MSRGYRSLLQSKTGRSSLVMLFERKMVQNERSFKEAKSQFLFCKARGLVILTGIKPRSLFVGGRESLPKLIL